MIISKWSKTSLDVVSDYVLEHYKESHMFPVRGIIHFKQKYPYEDEYEDCIEYFEVNDNYNIEWLHDFCEGQTDVKIISLYCIESLINLIEHREAYFDNRRC